MLDHRHDPAADGLAGLPRTTGVRRASTSPSRTSTPPAACSARTSSGIPGDSGDATTDTANQTVDRLLSQNVDAIIGAASSGVSLTVIDKITGAGVVQFSPANTSKTLSDYPDKGLYFRTAPSDILQGADPRRGHRR